MLDKFYKTSLPCLQRILYLIFSNILEGHIAFVLQRKNSVFETIFTNPLKPYGFYHSYQLDQLISFLSAVGWYFSLLFKIKENIL